MKISKSIVLPEWESIEDLSQASDILHKITEAMKDHQIQNYDDAVASFRQITTGRIQSQDGETYFDLDSGVIRGEIVFRPGSSGLENIEEASPNDWDNAFRLANAVKGDSDFTLISGGKIITESIAVGAFNSDVVARIFASSTNKTNIEAWMKSGHITYIDGNKIYTGSILVGGLGTTIISGGKIITSLLTATNIRTGTLRAVRVQIGGGTDEDIYFEDSGIRLYDVGAQCINFYHGSYKTLQVGLGSSLAGICCTNGDLKLQAAFSGAKVIIAGLTKTFYFYDTGEIQYPLLTSAPTGAKGRFAYNSSDDYPAFRNASAWRHYVGLAGW